MYAILFLLYAGLVRLGQAAYTIQDNFNASNWADAFDFFVDPDPTHGFVNYVNLDKARSQGLFKTDDNVVIMASDSTSIASKKGRDSLRLKSKNRYTRGLFVIDLAHMPGNACGMWPAFWTFGPEWPISGEIDIIEGANLQIGNKNTMHTSDGCSFHNRTCQGNMGCAKTKYGGENAYGNGFNAIGGGIYAMEWTSHHIGFWSFPRGYEPEDVLGDAPDPSRWGPPHSDFVGGSNCDIDSHFMNHQIVFDMTFCGDWAGGTFILDQPCLDTGLNCTEYVRTHPEAYVESYWTVNVLKVYSRDNSGSVVLTSRDTIPASTPALSINTSLPTASSDSNPLTSLPSLLTSLPSLPTSVPGNDTIVVSAEQQVGTGGLPLVLGGSPTPTTLYISEGRVIDAAPTAAGVFYTAPTANEFGDHPSDGNAYDVPKMKRAHRAARHLENHKSGIHG